MVNELIFEVGWSLEILNRQGIDAYGNFQAERVFPETIIARKAWQQNHPLTGHYADAGCQGCWPNT